MSVVPSSPSEFFGNYLPAWFKNTRRAQHSSPGALVFHVGGVSYALRLTDGELHVDDAPASDAILQVSLSPDDFSAFIKEGAALFEAGDNDRMLALRSLEVDAERAQLLRNVDGSVAFEVVEAELTRTLLLSPGALVMGQAPPACTIRAASEDFWALSRGQKNPFELLMEGRIRIQGRMDVAMALSSVLIG